MKLTARAVNGKPLLSNSSGSIIPNCFASFLSLSSIIGNGNSAFELILHLSSVHSTCGPLYACKS